MADAALGVTGGLVFVAERDGRLVHPGNVAHLRLQLTRFLEVAACPPLGGILPRLGRSAGELRCSHELLPDISLGFFQHSIGL